MAIQSTAKYQLQKIVLTMANALGQENAGAIAITMEPLLWVQVTNVKH